MELLIKLRFSFKVVPYTSGKIWSARLIFLLFLWQCVNISTVTHIEILTNSIQQTQSYKITSHIAAFLFVVLLPKIKTLFGFPIFWLS
jgi:hypothetical protein